MNKKAREHFDITRFVRETDDRKYHLLKNIYELPDLSYDRGSQQGDYEIRDRARELLTEIDSMYNTLKLFDNGKSGDVKAFEDILVFFQNSFIDTFAVLEKYRQLQREVDRRSSEVTGKNEGELPGDGARWSDSAGLADLKQKMKLFENRIVYEIAPKLRLFLNDVNRLLVYEKIKFLVENSMKSSEPEIVLRESLGVANVITTYLWINQKIYPAENFKSKVRDFAAAALRDLGLDEILASKSGMGKAKFEEMLNAVARDFEPPPACGEGLPPAPDCRTDEEQKEEGAERRNETSRILELVNELCSIGMEEKSAAGPGMKTGLGSKDRVEGRFLFHRPGSFEDSLKSVAEYMNDSLIFVFTFILGEIKKRSLSGDSAAPLLECVPLAEMFNRVYREGLAMASDPGNQSRSLMDGEVKQYVTLELARALHGLVLELGTRIDEAFTECYIGIDEKSHHRESVTLKKLKIMHEAFSNALTRVYATMDVIKITA